MSGAMNCPTCETEYDADTEESYPACVGGAGCVLEGQIAAALARDRRIRETREAVLDAARAIACNRTWHVDDLVAAARALAAAEAETDRLTTEPDRSHIGAGALAAALTPAAEEAAQQAHSDAVLAHALSEDKRHAVNAAKDRVVKEARRILKHAVAPAGRQARGAEGREQP